MDELRERLGFLKARGRLLEAQRLEQRTLFDMEMLREIGYCHGIENYSRHLSGRKPGQNPPTLMDYLPKDALVIIDESHVTVPQIRGMYPGDRSRKEALVEYGFRLPSAFDNRPLTFDGVHAPRRRRRSTSRRRRAPTSWSAPGGARGAGERPRGRGGGGADHPADRPHGPEDHGAARLLQVDDLMAEVRARAEREERVLITTLTKRMAEDLTEYYQQNGLRVRYLHSDIDTLDRVAVIRDLRLGKFDALVGINLLREGLDLPEVSLVAILDADKEGYLRSATSLIQTAGRAARHVNGEVIMYADTRDRLDAGGHRGDRAAARGAGGVQPRARDHPGVGAALDPGPARSPCRSATTTRWRCRGARPDAWESPAALAAHVAELEGAMKEAARRLDFERAAELRDRIKALRKVELGVAERMVLQVGADLLRGGSRWAWSC